MLRKMNGCLNLNFIRYVVCRKCHTIYHLKDCINAGSKRCPHIAYPGHPHRRMRQPCDTLLLKTVELCSRKIIYYPFITYCYMSLECSLGNLLQRENMYPLYEAWRSRRVENGELKDVYDGKIWSEFMNYNGTPFLSKPFSFGLMINVDWFQPYKHVQYSVGAIYLIILNLPRHMRNKTENIILLGIMPGPHESSYNVNSYITPLVEELNNFWHGKEMNVSGFSSKQVIRCALLCAACDLPAGRKLCGFLSFNARYGCTRCMKEFPGEVGSMDYSGFNRENWSKRVETEHRRIAAKIKSCKTKSGKSDIESSSGYRYTALLELPYFNPSRMLVLDPMHNLFLGTAKHYLKSVWLDRGILSSDDFDSIQSKVNKVVVPADLGRIPYKIASGFSSFTADQFKNWVLYYSLLVLRDKLKDEHLECWRHFVLGCRLLCSKSITPEKLKLADALLLQFCKRTERLYGKDVITPNMHIHTHMRECVLDYGPLHGFWLFSFERFNGILGQQPNNNRSIEIQLMSRFLRDCIQTSMSYPQQFAEDFSPIFIDRRLVGTLSDSLEPVPFHFPLDINNTKDWSSNKVNVLLSSHCSRGIFSQGMD